MEIVFQFGLPNVLFNNFQGLKIPWAVGAKLTKHPCVHLAVWYHQYLFYFNSYLFAMEQMFKKIKCDKIEL